MSGPEHDPGLDALLVLDGQIFFIESSGRYWVKFEVRRVEGSSDRPHGLRYSLTLHDGTGTRLVGFDNAHQFRSGAGPGRAKKAERDHAHRFDSVRAYRYRDAATLLADFWAEVDRVLKERGINR